MPPKRKKSDEGVGETPPKEASRKKRTARTASPASSPAPLLRHLASTPVSTATSKTAVAPLAPGALATNNPSCKSTVGRGSTRQQTPTPAQTATQQLSSAAKYKGHPRPPVTKTWSTFGIHHATKYLQDTETFDAYCISCRYFHGWLALVTRAFTIDKLKQIFTACLPAFLKNGEEFEQKLALKEFESAYVWVKNQLQTRFRAYATAWLETPAGQHYQEAYRVHW